MSRTTNVTAAKSSTRIASLALVAALSAAGCTGAGGSSSAGGGVTGGGAAAGGGVGVPASAPAGVWLAGDMHQHTSISPDANIGDDPAMSLRLAERAGLDFTCLTDHRTFDILNNQAGLQHPTVIGIPGMEWNGTGHANVIGFHQPGSFPTDNGGPLGPNDTTLQVMDAVHAQGGIFVVNHPSYGGDLWIWTTERADAIEVWNGNWTLRAQGAEDGAFVNQAAANEGVSAPELAAACDQWRAGGLNRQSLAFWESLLLSGRKLAAVGGGDRHYLVMPGNPTTRVFAADRSQAAILEAVRRGRTIVARGPDGPHVEFTADRNGDGVFETMIGDSVRIGEAVTFKARVVDADGGRVDLVRDGQVIQRWAVTGPDFEVTYAETPAQRSFYRLDVYEPLDMTMPSASTLKSLVLLGGQSWLTQLTSGQGFLGNLLSFASGILAQVQRAIDAGGAPLVWLLLNGDKVGVKMSPVPTQYPTMEFPEAVSRMLNIDMLDTDYARGAITSPIYAE